MAEERKFIKKTAAVNVKIGNVNKDHPRVAVLGTIVEKDDAVLAIVLDDGKNTINAILKNEETYSKLSAGQIVRVIGKVWGEGEQDREIQAEIVQDFSGIDAEQYSKVFLE